MRFGILHAAIFNHFTRSAGAGFIFDFFGFASFAAQTGHLAGTTSTLSHQQAHFLFDAFLIHVFEIWIYFFLSTLLIIPECYFKKKTRRSLEGRRNVNSTLALFLRSLFSSPGNPPNDLADSLADD